MLTNSGTSVIKIKTPKSSRDASDSEYTNNGDNFEGSGTDQDVSEANNRYQTFSKETRFGRGSLRSRTRSTEFRPSRSSGGRGGTRGRRGDPTSRRSEREYSDATYSSRRYESAKNNDSSSGYRAKFYELEKKSDIKLNLPEDTRISKLLRRLNNETNQDNSLAVSKKLLEVLLLPDNAPYVRKAFHILGESMYEILHVSPGLVAKQQTARALGRMGYIMAREGDFERYHGWLFSKINNSYEDMQILLIASLKETLEMDGASKLLEDHIESLIGNLVGAIELTENAEVFKVILSVLVMAVETYPNEFYGQFRDTIDLLFGWHVDHTQPLSNIEFISKSLQKLAQHFKCHLEFCVSLVENFLEDIVNYYGDLSASESREHVTVLVLALNTVLKCLGPSFHPGQNKYVLGDLERFYKRLVPNFEPFVKNNPFQDSGDNDEDPQLTVTFLLRCLAQLANASSIIVMWALKPSILELVGVKLRPYDAVLSKKTPYLQYGLLYLLYSHCKCYSHFVSSSSLVAKRQELTGLNRFALTEGLSINDGSSGTSPNSGNFAIILDVIYCTLKTDTSAEVTLLLLQWLGDVLVNSDSYLEAFYLHEKFARVTDALVKTGYHFNSRVVEAVCDNLEKLLGNKQLSWSNAFLTDVIDLCKLQMNSNEASVRERYAKLSAHVPWDVAVVEFNKVNGPPVAKHPRHSNDFNSYMIYLAQTLHLNGSVDGEFNPQQFRSFMDYLLNDARVDADFLRNAFVCCWALDSESQMNMELFYDLAMNSRQVLGAWCTLEAAQFCVNCKLRTPLGKPNETFTKIEYALNQLGNDLVTRSANATEGQRVRMLLQFVEHLEKSIANAADGSAVAMPQPTKAVRSFFVANGNTCNEWLSRIRKVVMHVALHSGENGIALRHGQCLLRDLVAAGKATAPEFERVAMLVALSLLNLKEPEALCGLYAWCKAQTGRRYAWIRCAAEQASKRYELAAEGYKKLLREARGDAEDRQLDADVRGFVADQIVHCYKELNSWGQLFEWRDEEEDAGVDGKKYWFGTVDWDCNRKLYEFEAGGAEALADLAEWRFAAENASWSVYENLAVTETNLYHVALDLAAGGEGGVACAEQIARSLDVVREAVQDNLCLAPSDFLQTYCLLQYVGTGLKSVAENAPAHTVFLVSEQFDTEIDKIDTLALRKILWWSEYFGRVQDHGFNAFTGNLRLDIAKRARKEKNYGLAAKHLSNFFADKGVDVAPDLRFTAADFMEKFADVGPWTLDVSKAVTEVIKLCHTSEYSRSTALNLCASVSTALSKYGAADHRKISSKILLKLAGWLQSNENVNVTDMTSPLGKLIMVLPDIGMMDAAGAAHVVPLNEMAVGKLLQFGAHQCPSLAKSWNAFGTWCYRWGKKITDRSADINLSDEHCSEIRASLPSDTSEDDYAKIFRILSQTRSIVGGGDDEDIDSNEINTSDMIRGQLQQVAPLADATEDQLRGLVQIWKSTQRRVYTYYALSAEAYFKYLHLVLNEENVSRSTECDTVTITLRLLRLIVKYALELQSILEEGLQTTPTRPWKVIIPQLFSRLNHPEGYVRHRVSDLLCRVAEDAPQLITFPAVVGALEGGLKFDFSDIRLPKDCLSQNNDEDNEADEEEDNNYESDNEESINSLQGCFKSMVETLSKQDPETITQVQTLVKELRRITLLWDELWLGTLAQHQSEIAKRQAQLEYEIDKVNENASLSTEEKASMIAEKHRIIIKPIVYVLEQLRDVTGVEAETPHEKLFQQKYLDDVDAVIAKLKNPDAPERPAQSLAPLRQLQKKFQQRFHKRASYSLKMQDISPVLHSIKNTLIAMPGLSTSGHGAVTISHVSNVVSILPTKTKPKKLVFYGSDGQTYTYLFKGLEDLHLDERIMQFLSIANTMMAQNADPAGHNLYRARHYSVIPLGPRSGLISWVDGTTPVFALYKRWQQRELAKPNPKGISANNTTVLRPSELFYNKLLEHGVKNIENRKEWPLAVLKEVLAELMAETPCDLLAKELWLNSVSASSWWQVVKRYSYSVAVMSIIGYIIGLGDRHLDNVLIDLSTGDVVHIDYNVCFEKGKTLRVPEKVPFRLTPNVREALGVTGIEGIFRLACENVLKIMRKGRETLLTLLEAFVYDPLIDWTIGGEVLAGTSFGSGVKITADGGAHRQSKKELEREVTLAMFNVRCVEMKVEWQENRDEILNEIPNLIDHLNTCLALMNDLEEIEDQLQDLHQQLALVKEAEAQGPGKHSLYKLPSLYSEYVQAQEAMNTARKGLADIIRDCEGHAKTFDNLLTLYEKQQFSQWLNELKYGFGEEAFPVFDLVKEFLHNAGKDDMIAQCEQSEQKVTQISQHLNVQTRKCIQIFQDYFSLLVQCPKSYIANHRMDLFTEWAQYLLDTKSTEGCDVVFDKARHFLESKTQNSTQIVNVAFILDRYSKEALIQVNKLYDELAIRRTKEPNALLEKMYGNAKLNASSFLQSEKGAVNAFKFVIAGELLLLNRNFLTLEIAAQRSGDCLIKLTSRDGDWFLDDLLLHSTRAVEMVNNLPVRQDIDDARFYQLLNGVRTANGLYKALYDLNFNFHTIILPESMKKIQADEESALKMINDVNAIIAECDSPIPDTIAQLEKFLTCILMHIDVHTRYDFVLEKIATIESKFLALIPTQSESLSQGQMLLMGFNGLFDKLTQEINDLVKTLGELDVPKSWKKLDHVKEAKNIAPHIFNPQVRRVLENIFFLKRVLAISEFFGLARDTCHAIRCNAPAKVYGDEQLTRPVKRFVAEFISRQLLGVTPEIITYVICAILQQLGLDVTHEIEQKDIGAESKVPLDELYHKAYNVLMKDGTFTANIVSQASSLEANLKLSWEKIQEPKKIEQKLTVLQSSAFRLQSQLYVHNLMFDDVLARHNVASVRARFVADMQAGLTGLQTLSRQLGEASDAQQILIEKAQQRLNWAKGANPNVSEILAAFENAVRAMDARLNVERTIATKVLTSYDIVLQHELLRCTGLDATKEYDKLFLNCYEKWRIACHYNESKTENLLPAEESILNMLSLDLVDDPEWPGTISVQITDAIAIYQKKLAEKNGSLFSETDCLVSVVDNFKTLYNIHTKLMQDVRGLLKTMAKLEECAMSAQDFIRKYRSYVEHFNAFFDVFNEVALDKDRIARMLAHLDNIRSSTADVHESLLALRERGPQLTRQGRTVVDGADKRDVRGQQRNAYAVNVWRRVKMKLEGRDPDPGRKLTAQEQVDYVIREATNLDNLALLYEGWTPWV
ncbi:serine/threonine-protein kinase SMG1 isoform X2 [Cylas formicarius]|uniref:serine/threonine-protein kinase SMG1 isoform X2 n=1 Tax=Cylas formicarius TaxID=197179 RepID=UPI0029585535|nr:serine/threonine-protein kinase SMG1 isoform X2 [Cylas formicarius]